MALSTQQIAGLNALNQKISSGYTPTATDQANLAYATKQGYTYTPLTQGATKIAGPSGLQGLNESQIYRSGTDIYKLPSIPTQVSGDQLTGGVPNVPVVAPQEVDQYGAFGSMIDTSQKGAEALFKAATTPTPSEAKITPITQKITELTGGYEQKPTDYQAQLDQYGFKTNIQDLQNLNVQLAAKKAEFDKLSEQNANLPISSRIIGGTQDRIQRQAAIELGGLSSMAQALQGNVQMAMDIADKTIAIKYEPLEKQIEDQKFQLEQVYDQLGREEQRKADALNIALDERARKIEEEKDTEKGINEVMLAAAQGTATSSDLQKIMKAKTYQEAIQLAAPFLKEKLSIEEQQALLDGGYRLDPEGNVVVDYGHDPITGAITDPSKVINGYNFTSYATDPNWGYAIKRIMEEELPALNDVQDLADYISKKTGDPKQAFVTASAIWNAALENGVDVEVLAAIAQHESGFAKSNVARNNNNPGGITWNKNYPVEMKGTARPAAEGGNYVKFANLTEGFSAVAKNIARRKQEDLGVVNETDQTALDIFNGTGDLNKVPAKDYQAVQNKLAQLKAEALANGNLEGVMRASAGGKDVDATTVTSFEKAFNVIGQLSDIQNSITDESTGPIMGIIRSNNPYDAKARLIQAQLTALVPNLARGIYGEVGVLTDNDVKLYSQTLPNLKSTEEVRDLILAATVRSVQRSIENKIKVQAGLGRDVSGLVDSYNEIKATADQLEGGSQAPVNESQAVTDILSGLEQEKPSVWNWFRGLFGASAQPSMMENINTVLEDKYNK